MALLYISTALKWLLRKKTASSLGLRSCSRNRSLTATALCLPGDCCCKALCF